MTNAITQPNSPVDITPEDLQRHKDEVEAGLAKYTFEGKDRALHELVMAVDKKERFIMSETEADTYKALRDGMTVFKAVVEKVGEKVGLQAALRAQSPKDIREGKESAQVQRLRGFTFNYATFVASKFIAHRLDDVVQKAAAGQPLPADKTDLTGLILPTNDLAEKGAIRHLMAPVYKSLVDHLGDNTSEFGYEAEFPSVTKRIFEQYATLALAKRDDDPELGIHVEKYQFRINGDELQLAGWDDKTIIKPKAAAQAASFQPITANEIVGNQAAKRKVTRYIERLCLYNQKEQKNAMLELGGLSWSNLFDGPPGTGKSSVFRLAMTILKARAEQIGVPYQIFSVDQSIKDEFYGKTGKILLARLAVTNDPAMLSLGIFDDIDLLTSKRDDAQGADNDVNNILMQYFDGVFTVRRGNVINFGASNKPTGLDDAMRNRFNDRLLIDGPVTPEDFADFTVMRLKSMMKRGLLKMEQGKGYTPFATQDQQNADGTWSGGKVAEYMADELHKYQSASIIDFGRFIADLKRKNPKITGRSANAIMEAVKERSADFNIPTEWFETRATFLDQPYATQVKMLGELYVPITPDVIFQEAMRYFDSEERFAQTEAKDQVQKAYNNRIWDLEAEARFCEDMASQVLAGQDSLLYRARLLQDRVAIERTEGVEYLKTLGKKIDDEIAKKATLLQVTG